MVTQPLTILTFPFYNVNRQLFCFTVDSKCAYILITYPIMHHSSPTDSLQDSEVAFVTGSKCLSLCHAQGTQQTSHYKPHISSSKEFRSWLARGTWNEKHRGHNHNMQTNRRRSLTLTNKPPAGLSDA